MIVTDSNNSEVSILTNIDEKESNIVIWQADISSALSHGALRLLLTLDFSN